MNDLSSPLGASIRIFLVDGIADGVRVVEKSNWTGKALMAPRTGRRISGPAPDPAQTALMQWSRAEGGDEADE